MAGTLGRAGRARLLARAPSRPQRRARLEPRSDPLRRRGDSRDEPAAGLDHDPRLASRRSPRTSPARDGVRGGSDSDCRRGRSPRKRIRRCLVRHLLRRIDGDGHEPRHRPGLRAAALSRGRSPRRRSGDPDGSHPRGSHVRGQHLAHLRYHDRVRIHPGSRHRRSGAEPPPIRPGRCGSRVSPPIWLWEPRRARPRWSPRSPEATGDSRCSSYPSRSSHSS